MMKLRELVSVMDSNQDVTIMVASKKDPYVFTIVEGMNADVFLRRADKYLAKEVFDYPVVKVWATTPDDGYHMDINIKLIED